MPELTSSSPPPLTVSELTQAIKLHLESKFLFIHLQGEMSNIKFQTSGHLYFTLKDSQAQIAAVMFKMDLSKVKTLPKEGDHVIVRGEINVYPPKGNYQIIVRELSYAGIGELLQKLELLKIKLHQMGWFKAARKKPLPRFPKCIGVVTSPTGAVIKDILHVLSRRHSGFHLILNPVKVQGEGAAAEIAQAIRQLNQFNLVDVMIVGRGGGSLEDLWAFNEEIVAEAIHQSRIPVISAVGHETDHCIADYVADVRAPTPSAAAEIVMAEQNQHIEYLNVARKRIQQHLHHLVKQNRYRLEAIVKQTPFPNPFVIVERRMQQLDDIRNDIDDAIERLLLKARHQLEGRSHQMQSLKPINQIAHLKQNLARAHKDLEERQRQRLQQARVNLSRKQEQLDQLWRRQQERRRHLFDQRRLQEILQQKISYLMEKSRHRLSAMTEVLSALDPTTTLKKGYSILFAEKDRSVINTVLNLTTGQQARLLLSDGEALVTINEVYSKK